MKVQMGRGSNKVCLMRVGQLPSSSEGESSRRSLTIITRGLDQIPMCAQRPGSMAMAIMGLTPAPTDDMAGDTSSSTRARTFPIHIVAPRWTVKIASGSTLCRAGSHRRPKLIGQLWFRIFGGGLHTGRLHPA